MIDRPEPDEYAPFYETYVRLVPEGDVLAMLRRQHAEALALLRAVPAERHDVAYAPGKWTVREVVRHMVDTEWLFTFRALHIARGDPAPLPGMEQELWMAHAPTRPLADTLDEFDGLRRGGLRLFEGFDEAALDRRGVASGHAVTVRALVAIIAGHTQHHLGLLRTRYLV